jgi:integrase
VIKQVYFEQIAQREVPIVFWQMEDRTCHQSMDMYNQTNISPNAYRVSSFLVDGKPHAIVQNKDTLEPSTALSIYEQFLSTKVSSHNSVKTTLKHLIYFFTWALSVNLDLEGLLLRGELLSAFQIRQFAYWLSCRNSKWKGQISSFSITAYNSALMHCSSLIRWFGRHYGVGISDLLSPTERIITLEAQKNLFADLKKKDRRVRSAPDLTEEEIAAIERYLKPANRTEVSREIAVRDYLVWRISIEFGMREGEILALRLCDIPHQGQNFIKIVRIDERIMTYSDPRGTNAPRPKTLSRDLGYLLANSPIPEVLAEYTTKRRYKLVERAGKKVKNFLPGHEFLIVNHHRRGGEPLSVSGLQRIAEKISQNTGISFHWHLPRHAFFNRAYAAISDITNSEEKKVKLMDLVVWGGWADEKSLLLYINRAKNVRAQKALMLWQKGGNTWAALG